MNANVPTCTQYVEFHKRTSTFGNERYRARVALATNNKPMLTPSNSKPSDVVPAFPWLRYLRKHWILGLLVALGVLLGDVFFTIGQRRIYEASATILIDPDPPRPLGKDVQTVVEPWRFLLEQQGVLRDPTQSFEWTCHVA